MNAAEISFVIVLGVMAAFYMIFIRPAQKEQKRISDTIRGLAIGDEVITTAGFFARIKHIETPEEGPVELLLDFGNGIEIRSLTTSIMRKLNEHEEPAEDSEVIEEAGGV
jgi:preprotein translocase subunit YajC